ncbi:MAG: IgA Peptidase M64 [Bacteroides sp.]|nr:IgA Peptidase M64 [Bacteroides sp.]MCM1447320.1 IgA Peptidase M64 [Bacteroides sp.]
MISRYLQATSLLVSMTLGTVTVTAQKYESLFNDATLRLDYIYAGTAEEQAIYLSGMKTYNGWYGKRINMNRLPLEGNGTITVTDTSGQDTIYRHSFSTLFQEWQSTEEATNVAKSFESTLLIPMPKKEVQVTVELNNMHNGKKAYLKHRIDPEDKLIRIHDQKETLPYTYLHRAGDSKDKIDVVFVPEGYTSEEMGQFRRDCEESIAAILRHKAFVARKDRLNFIAIDAPSKHSGVSIPKDKEWKSTAVGSHFDTFYSERYLTTPNISKLYDILDGIPCESIIILANTDEYGGGGIYNNYMLSAARGASYRSVIVHEFGHSFAGLADEYFYDDQYETYYPAGIEPWEQNLTTLTDFGSKWKDMLPKGTPIPTPADGKDIHTKVGVYEGGGYQSKGVYRPAQDCRMKTNEAPDFCPVCSRAIKRVIDFMSR